MVANEFKTVRWILTASLILTEGEVLGTLNVATLNKLLASEGAIISVSMTSFDSFSKDFGCIGS